MESGSGFTYSLQSLIEIPCKCLSVLQRLGKGKEHKLEFIFPAPPLLRLGPSTTTSPGAVSSINNPLPDTKPQAPSRCHSPREQ